MHDGVYQVGGEHRLQQMWERMGMEWLEPVGQY